MASSKNGTYNTQSYSSIKTQLMKSILKFVLVLFVTNGLAQNKVSIGKISLDAIGPTWLELKGPSYDKYMIIEIWEEKKWLIYSKLKQHKQYHNPKYRQAGYCNKKSGISIGIGVTPGKYVLRVVFDYKDTTKNQDYAKIIDTRKTL